jgi:uncharacterized membrane-anchored protein
MGVNLINTKVLFYGAVVIQILILLAITGTFYLTDKVGKEVHLKTEPVDPTDLFYGDYVILQYDIQTLPIKLWKGNDPIEESKKVYVVLDKVNDIYEAKAIYPEKPNVNENEVVIAGRYKYFQDDSTVFITYGIEKYYIKEGTGKEIEKQRDNLVVEVMIAPWGQKKINNIMTQTK